MPEAISPVAHRLTELLIRARRERGQFTMAEVGGDLRSAEEAYRVQDEVAAALGWFAGARPSAWKVGAGARNETPVAAPLPPAGVVTSPGQFARDSFHSIRIEAEIAFRFGDGAARGDDWKRWVDALVVTIEVVDTRIADVERATALVKLADAQQHGALIVGSAIPRRDLDWASLRAIVRLNGKVVADQRGGHPLGDPSVLLPWFVEHVAARGFDLRAGDLVTAGTWVGIVAAGEGDTIEAEFEDVGSASVAF
jgi:2-keto-4-pentenoate hydratase